MTHGTESRPSGSAGHPRPGLPAGAPTLRRVMVRPRWIVALLVSLGVAAGFAALGQWQLSRAIDTGHAVEQPSETVVPLERVAEPGAPIRSADIGQMVTVSGHFVAGDYEVIADRSDRRGDGYWVAGRFEVTGGGAEAALAVARGWTDTRAEAREVIGRLDEQAAGEVTLTGRMLPTEAPAVPPTGADPQTMTTMAVAALANRWHDLGDDDVYTVYLVDHSAPAGLEAIYSPPPLEQARINWLNLFYAAEWAIFAGFAVYFWYRLARDAWEREVDDLAEARAAAGSAGAAGGAGPGAADDPD